MVFVFMEMELYYKCNSANCFFHLTTHHGQSEVDLFPSFKLLQNNSWYGYVTTESRTSLIPGNLGPFQVIASVNYDTIEIPLHISFCVEAFIYVRKIFQNGVSGQLVVLSIKKERTWRQMWVFCKFMHIYFCPSFLRSLFIGPKIGWSWLLLGPILVHSRWNFRSEGGGHI